MRRNILARNIRNEGLIPELFSVQNKAYLLFLFVISEVLGSQENAQFQRHVETRQVRGGIEFSSTYIVNTVLALSDDSEDFVYPGLTGILDFESAPWHEATVIDSEYYCEKERAINLVERAVDENAI